MFCRHHMRASEVDHATTTDVPVPNETTSSSRCAIFGNLYTVSIRKRTATVSLDSVELVL